jgi:Fe2+ transport system protein B
VRVNKNRWLALCLIALILGFGFGFVFGVEAGLEKCIGYGVHIAKSFVNVSFDEAKFTNLLIKYQTKIEGLI